LYGSCKYCFSKGLCGRSGYEGQWHDICMWFDAMFAERGEFAGRYAGAERNGLGSSEVNVVASEANWAWPAALRAIFQPREVNLMVAGSADEFLHIMGSRRIHTTIVDMDSEKANGLATVKVIRMKYPLQPCILLASAAGESILSKALELNVFSVIGKPVDMEILRQQLDRLFVKRYRSHIFH